MDSSRTMTTPNVIPYGFPVPPNTSHAILVSLPTWDNTVTCIEGNDTDTRLSGYPRFFIQVNIQKLAFLMERKYGKNDESCLLFPTYGVAEQCRLFVQARSDGALVRIVSLVICPENKQDTRIVECKDPSNITQLPSSANQLHIVLFPTDEILVAKLFWQLTGTGISSRFADHWLPMLPEAAALLNGSAVPPNFRYITNGSHKDYPVRPELCDYGINLPLADATAAKYALRKRIAGALNVYDRQGEPYAVRHDVTDVSENDVYLFPTGMNAIWDAHRLLLVVRPTETKSVCFGFLYCDTLKVLQKWGPGCHFYPDGSESEIDQLEALLEQELARDPTKPPIIALYTEFPTNPLLRSPNLPRLRALANKFDFLIVIDDTLGNFENVHVLPYADIIVTSLTKIFSGSANVMGGSLVLNPNGRHYTNLTAHINAHYEDTYYDEDAICMEQNSRDIQQRIKVIDGNAEVLCDFLRSRSIAGGATNTVIKDVFYPKYNTRENYDRCRKRVSNDSDSSSSSYGGGFGGLLSITFISNAASRAFYESLDCFRGPSLGTNFTLAVLYTILGHYEELEWAAQCGVEEGLVRVSVGMENTEKLLKIFEASLDTAKKAVGVAAA